MKLVAVMPQSEAFASLYNVIEINVLILVIALVIFVFLITLILQRKVIKPLGMMMQDAQKLLKEIFLITRYRLRKLSIDLLQMNWTCCGVLLIPW